MVDTILAILASKGITMYTMDGRLYTSAPKGQAIPPAVAASIREHREALIREVEARQIQQASNDHVWSVSAGDLAPRLAAFRAAAWNVNAIPYLFLPWALVVEGMCVSCGESPPYQDSEDAHWCRCLPCLVAARIVREEHKWPYPVDSVIGYVMRRHSVGYAAAYKIMMGRRPSRRVMATWSPVEAMAAQHMRKWRQWGRS